MSLFPYIETRTGGWRHEDEDFVSIAKSRSTKFLYSADGRDLPEEVCPVHWVPVENQGSIGSCQGHSLSSCLEHLTRASGYPTVSLSRMCGYIMSQRRGGYSGRDTGSTISDGIAVAMEDGLCEESVWPYPPRYSDRLPPDFQGAPKWRLGGHVAITSYEDMLDACAFNVVHSGFMWGAHIDQQVAKDGVIRSYRGGAGGHSVMWRGFRRQDWKGNPLPQPYLLLCNSWSTQWGHKGWALVSPEAFSQILNSRWAVFERMFDVIAPVERRQPSY